MTDNFHRAILVDELADNGAKGVMINGWPVLLARVDGKYLAVIDRCTHAMSQLSTGRIRRGIVMCPLHGARFELVTGICIGQPYRPLRTFETRIADRWVEVSVPEEGSGLGDV